MRKWMMVSTLMLSCFGCGGEDIRSGTDGGDDSTVARGRYLVNDVAMCSFCHTPRRQDGVPDQTRFLAGVDCLVDAVPDDDELGCINARNLTNHETGLANASDEEIKNALLNGVGTDGRNLFPLMPYWVFHNMTDDDANAIVAYLRTVAAVDKMTPPNQAPFTEPEAPFPPIDPDDIPLPRQDFEDQDSAMRGRYLSTMVSLCVDCHTPETEPGSLVFDFTKTMAGGRAFPATDLGYPVPPYPEVIYASNLTPHATGLDGYSHADIVKVMKEGLTPDGEGVCAPTHSGPTSPFAGLTDQDVSDIANYLLSLPPVDNEVVEDCVGPPPS